ncbi:hypothetical protein CMV_024001 [Castanea mollissima]|uniref:Uncharacterized protein n=1 Tax=Castanea mollissima TaxID=60419 RepID=A0A8J4QF16_9ROSI|nr:hypothetical protein CMV_024001 [Castanea mollissima]
MELRVVVICAVIGVLGLSSVIMGFVAERTRIKDSQVMFDGFSCVCPHSPATALGLVALLAIILAQIISISQSSRITVVIAAVMLLLASSSYTSYKSTVQYCYVMIPGVFAAGAILCLASVVLGLASYILSLQKNSNNLFQGDIAMAQPQFAGGTSIYQGATPIGQPQYQWGNPAVPNQGDMPMGHTKFPQ